jgi:acetoacetyl-CoA reductase
MAGRVAIVTGGTRGIGAAISVALKKMGCQVAATYVGNVERAAAFGKDTGIKAYKWDVGDFDACQKGVAQVAQEIGGVEILINNAGITRDVMLHRMTKDQWHQVIDASLTGTFNMARAVIEGMRARNFGRIVNISSINGQAGQMGQTNYTAAKAGMVGFTKSLALESAAKGITVNVVAPGYIDTEMVAAVPADVMAKVILPKIPVGRLGKAEEIARAVVFLAADESGFITGATLSANGGQYMTG